MKISVALDSAAVKAQLRRRGGELRDRLRTSVSRALASEAAALKHDVRRQVAGQMKVANPAFLNSFTARVLDQDPNRLPGLCVGSRIPWAGIHETGGTITGKMWIPLQPRVGARRFQAQIAALVRSGNAFFVKNAKGNIVLMAENVKAFDRPLSGFKRRYRKAAGIQRLKRGAAIPFAVLVPKVTIKKRLDIEKLVAGRIPLLSAAIERQIRWVS